MQVEQIGVNKIKISLDNALESATIGKADKLEVVIEQISSVGYSQENSSKTIEVSKDE